MNRVRILKPLRHRDFRLLWTGMTASLIGDGIFLVSLAWQVYELSNAPTALSIVGVAMTVPQIVFLLVGGVLSDRFDRRRVMIAADALRAISVAILGVLSITGTLELWHVLIVAASFGAGTAFFGPAFDAIVPQLVPSADLNQANSLDQFVRPAGARMLGPAVGGWLIAAGGPGIAFLIDAGTFVLSIACVALMRSRALDRTEQHRSAFQDVREGFRFVRSRVWLWGTFLAATLAYLIFWGPSEVLLPFILKNHMHGSASDLGFILALGGVGAMFAAIVMGNREMPRRHITFMYGVWTISTVAIAGYGLASFPWQLMVASFVFNALEGAGTIVWATTKGRLVPARLLGRVSSFDWFISTGLVPVSFALTGPVAAFFGPRTTLVGAGILGGIVTLGFLFLPGMRDIERSGDLPHASQEDRDRTLAAIEGTLVPSRTPAPL
ncbi:MAG: MFS transporter [Actinomycetota bacterium]|nr:MFS transporter [Actinomycetota bacterium]